MSKRMSILTAPRNEKPVTPDGGDPAALLARTQDLSRRLHEREEFYRSILESLGEGVIITDRESRILYANSRIECLTGHSRPELIGTVSYELLSPKQEWPAMRRRLKESPAAQRAMTTALVALTIVMGIGEVLTFLRNWRPLLAL